LRKVFKTNIYKHIFVCVSSVIFKLEIWNTIGEFAWLSSRTTALYFS
jgi:hypothetical protein